MKHDCILSDAKKQSFDGYCLVFEGGKYVKAHRLAYAKANGISLSDIKDMAVRHACDERKCVNPDHLSIGTWADNVRDRVERDRSAKGARNGNAKLTESDIPFIRYWLSRGYSDCAIARAYSVGRCSIRWVRTGRCWAHVAH